ncbi:tetraspanin-8-like [Branchiostoma lanceolatum]|uniref:tetraspanin-8-like n=1 Tax=Branchiostoma lanceolatum TaxID=7740 RepID=UPI0034529868
MADGCCASCSKILLFIFNTLFWLMGAGLLTVGIWSLLDPGLKNLTLLDLSYLNAVSYMCIAAGGVIMVVGFLGCCGAITENKCMLVTFAICQFLIFGLMLSAGIVGLVYRDRVSKELTSVVNDIVDSTTKIDQKPEYFRDATVALQETFKCCGYDSYNNWQTPSSVSSCDCSRETDKDEYCNSSNPRYYRSCQSLFADYLSWGVQLAAIIAMALSVLPLIGLCMTICLIKGVNNDVGVV